MDASLRYLTAPQAHFFFFFRTTIFMLHPRPTITCAEAAHTWHTRGARECRVALVARGAALGVVFSSSSRRTSTASSSGATATACMRAHARTPVPRRRRRRRRRRRLSARRPERARRTCTRTRGAIRDFERVHQGGPSNGGRHGVHANFRSHRVPGCICEVGKKKSEKKEKTQVLKSGKVGEVAPAAL